MPTNITSKGVGSLRRGRKGIIHRSLKVVDASVLGAFLFGEPRGRKLFPSSKAVSSMRCPPCL